LGSKNAEQNLAPPGAGVPFIEGLMLRWFVGPLIAAKAGWEETAAKLEAVNKKIEAEVAGIAPADMTKKVLVPKMQGLEDSSRNWSAAMTLEHMVVVGRGVCAIMRSLAEGKVPPGKASTAAVKPTGGYAPEAAVAAFRLFCNTELPAVRAALKDPESKATFAHPWMGPLTARGWHWMLSAHHGVHLRQLRGIRKGLQA
jgi:hypothetical protein